MISDHDLSLSADGRFVAFGDSGTGLVPGQQNASPQHSQILLFDRADGTNRLVSGALGSPQIGSNGVVSLPVISADGSSILYWSTATDAGLAITSGGGSNLFHFDRRNGSTRLVSHVASSATVGGGQGVASPPAISADGRIVAYASKATNLVAGQVDRPGSIDVFVWDRDTESNLLASRSVNSPVTSNAPVHQSVIVGARTSLSADGAYLAFQSLAPDLVPGQVFAHERAFGNLFLFDRLRGSLELVNHTTTSAVEPPWGGAGGVVSADGSSVVFTSGAPGITDGDYNGTSDLFLFRRSTWPGSFFTLPPCRIADTRGAGQSPVRTGLEEAWPIHASCGIPSTAKALSVNVTVVTPGGDGYLTLFSGDQPLPPTSTINFRAGQVRANNAVVPLALDGSGRLGVSAVLGGTGRVHVVLDVNGYFE